jgi:hypothetical protein
MAGGAPTPAMPSVRSGEANANAAVNAVKMGWPVRRGWGVAFRALVQSHLVGEAGEDRVYEQ